MVESPVTTLTPFRVERIAKRACSGVAPGANSTRKPLTLPFWRTAGGPPPMPCTDPASASSVAKLMNTPRSCVPTPVRPSRP